MYSNGLGVEKNHVEACKWFRAAADQGNAPAQCNLGFMYQHGLGVEKNHVEACKLYRAAADQGDAQAQYNLGTMCEFASGNPQDIPKAIHYYKKAEEGQYRDASDALVRMCLEGKVKGVDPVLNLVILEKAANGGHVAAKAVLPKRPMRMHTIYKWV